MKTSENKCYTSLRRMMCKSVQVIAILHFSTVFDLQCLVSILHADMTWSQVSINRYTQVMQVFWSTSLYLKGLQNCSSSKLAHTSHLLGIKPGPTKSIWPARSGFDYQTTRSIANFDELQFWSPLIDRYIIYIFGYFKMCKLSFRLEGWNGFQSC